MKGKIATADFDWRDKSIVITLEHVQCACQFCQSRHFFSSNIINLNKSIYLAHWPTVSTKHITLVLAMQICA